jgi:multidrug efflux system membrane fusion protein
VQVATADGNDAVIASGLQPGMLVVSAGVHVLSPGQKVTVWQEKTFRRAAGGRAAAARQAKRRRGPGRHLPATR